jgi:hypothetical protein
MTHDPLCPIINTTCIDGPHVLILEAAPGYYVCDACQRECQCDLITAAHERGYKEAEVFYTNECMICGYSGEWSEWTCDDCLKDNK